MFARVLATTVVVVGVVLVLLGGTLFLNYASLRDLVVESRLDPAIAVVFDTRDEMSHRRAQALELLTGVAGLGAILGAGAWLLSAPRTSGSGE